MIRYFLCVLLSSFMYAGDKPNIIFILADDLGWAELGSYGNDFNETPHLDKMAKAGIPFAISVFFRRLDI
ncbi:sulfatase-like hydrolase/transferase [Lentisphaera marina]|uniref:sulfatase-like hydrolase/transferase n=1 Tax=Lentisphaera marina TaxID=1111041 RepID=UPI002367032B|nr:sulfatase-like hydrolase/transferase [Lentisphaera marina]MDD7987271.1 sulfatase-like hydrolase/transferase [Lentisphaera marina]